MSLEHSTDWYLGCDIARPSKSDFTTYYLYHKGQVIFKGTSEEYKRQSPIGSAVLERAFDMDAYNAAVDVFNAERKARNDAYRRDIFAEHGMTDHPKANDLWKLVNTIADRQSGNHDAVEELFGDIANLIKG